MALHLGLGNAHCGTSSASYPGRSRWSTPYTQQRSPMRGHNRLTRVMRKPHALRARMHQTGRRMRCIHVSTLLQGTCAQTLALPGAGPISPGALPQPWSTAPFTRWCCPTQTLLSGGAPLGCVHAPQRLSALPSCSLAQRRPYCRQHLRPHALVPWRPWLQPPPVLPHLRRLHVCPRVLPQPGHHPLHVLPVRPSSGPAVLGAVGEVAGRGATQCYVFAMKILRVHQIWHAVEPRTWRKVGLRPLPSTDPCKACNRSTGHRRSYTYCTRPLLL